MKIERSSTCRRRRLWPVFRSRRADVYMSARHSMETALAVHRDAVVDIAPQLSKGCSCEFLPETPDAHLGSFAAPDAGGALSACQFASRCLFRGSLGPQPSFVVRRLSGRAPLLFLAFASASSFRSRCLDSATRLRLPPLLEAGRIPARGSPGDHRIPSSISLTHRGRIVPSHNFRGSSAVRGPRFLTIRAVGFSAPFSP